ncbi:Long-chain-fatty-acid--CoA ligase 5 [Schistosoma japonicum]|nr:Long-chain-fatty-acid--CoA ligase 5 [Schistosoma japonicum]KAH8865695.1 Long-chain-fatty-acid--CoA ligase 5 [Schistosoma japonicum]
MPSKMQCKLCLQSDYPHQYYKVHKPDVSEPYVCPHLNKQSIIIDSETGARKSPFTTRFTLKFSDVRTVKDLFEKGLETSRFQPCLGRRFSQDEPYIWLKYIEVDDKIQVFGSALTKVAGHIPWDDNCVGIYGRNSPEWFITQHACAAYGFPIVPIYATLGDEAMRHILELTGLRVIICDSGEEAFHILEGFSSSINLVIVVNDGPKVAEAKVRFSSKVKIYLFEEFLNPKPDDLYMVCFTSGSTGLPKGVLIEHQQIVDAVFGIIENTEEKCCNKLSTHLSYLPFAHIMEQVNSSVVIIEGAKIGFLTDTIDGLLADCESLKPTVLTAVPRVLSRIYSKYYEVVERSSLKTLLVKCIIEQKLNEQKRGKFNHQSFLDTICFRKLRQNLGGRICGIITGGAPLMPEILQFMRVVFNGLVVEGFGCTETTGVITVSVVGEFRVGALGAVAYGVEVKLADVPDLGLVVKRDNRGEICVRGKRCTKGYYKNAQDTAELIDSDGWLHTGDIGEWTLEGSLTMVDRIKSYFKLAHGEYVAPEKLEAIYQSSSLISQILIDGNPKYSYPIGIIVPNFMELRESLNITDPELVKLSDYDLCQNKIVNRKFLNVLNQIANQWFLKGFEKLKKIHLTNEAFTVENGLLTPTLKIYRPKVKKMYAEIIDKLCEEIVATENHK